MSSVKRRVHFSEREGKRAASVSLSRQFDVEPRVLWKAVTAIDEIPKWFSPVTGELKLGGSYALEGNAHGIIQACEPLTRVALTWEFSSDVSWVDLKFVNKTQSEVTFDLNHTSVLSPHWDEYGAGATGVGWETSYLGLYLYLMYPHESKLDEEAFVASDEGKHFVSTSSKAWAEASILAGTDSKAAIAAADRTTAFYLGL